MMPFRLYDYLTEDGTNEIAEWTKRLQRKDQGKLASKLDMLERHGKGLFPQALTWTKTPGILKLRVHGNVQLRPMLCEGTVNVSEEFTLLLGAKEIGDVLEPERADRLAYHNKIAVVADPKNRRTEHECVR